MSRYRLVTRSDFDGLVCAALLKQLDLLGEVKFVHPKDVQDGKVEIGPGDITTNLPYTEAAHLAFDHHMSELLRLEGTATNHVIDPDAASAARLVYEYYGGAEAFPGISSEMMEEVDKADAARFSLDEILNPDGWVLLSFLMDPRTGLGRFRDFRISNYNLMNTVFATGKSIVNRSSGANVGELMLEYGGGGHEAAGTCQIDNERASEVLNQLVGRLTARSA